MSYYQQEEFDYLILSEVGNDPTRMSLLEWQQRNEFIAQACLQATVSGPFLSAERRMMWIYQVPPCE
jgi:hypothetical protein